MTPASEPEPAAADPLEVIQRHARAIRLALTAIDQANPQAEVLTNQCREIVNTLTISVGELKFFMPNRTKD